MERDPTGDGPPQTTRSLFTPGCLSAFLAVLFGAFGAHALKPHLTADAMD